MSLDLSKLQSLSDYNVSIGDSADHNNVLSSLLSNDLEIYGNFELIPRVWECRWYNNSAIKGYDKGAYCWMNTEDMIKFLKNNSKKIKEYTDANPLVEKKLPEWKTNDDEVYEQYLNALSGYVDEKKSKPLSAIFEIGFLSACTQMMVSQKNDNKDPIKEKKSWKKFFIDDEDESDIIQTKIYAGSEQRIEEHMKYYHFGSETKDALKKALQNLDMYADADLGNVKKLYANNYLDSKIDYSHGFDTVQYYFKRPYIRDGKNKITEFTWFRIWRSGYLEHGGTINIKHYLNYDKSKVVIPLTWKLTDDSVQKYNLKYLGNSKENYAYEIDETDEDVIPADNTRDNLISFIYPEKENIILLSSDCAPKYSKMDYIVNLTPIQSTTDYSSGTDNLQSLNLDETTAYDGLGRNVGYLNKMNTDVDYDNSTLSTIVFDYHEENTPDYYEYYASGFWHINDYDDEDYDTPVDM